MRCPNCHNELGEDALYCSHCGIKIEKCKHCHQPVIPGAKYCSSCGASLQRRSAENHLGGYYEPIQHEEYAEPVVVDSQDTDVDKKVNKKAIIIAVIALIVVTAGSAAYLMMKPQLSEFITQSDNTQLNTESTMTISGTTSFATYTGNINQNGTVYQDGKQIYMCDDNGQLIVMDSQINNQKVLIKEKCQYISVTDDYIYYVDNSYYLHRIKKDGTAKEDLISKSVYYVIVKNDKIYYQLDSDHESLYVYDLASKKETKLNERSTYNINVTDDCIYYTSNDGLYKIGLDGQGEEKIMSGNIANLIYQDKKLYYMKIENNVGYIYIYDIESQDQQQITNKGYSLFNVTDKYLFYLNNEGALQRYDFSSQKEKTIFNGTASSVQIVGDKLVVMTASSGYGNSETYQVIMDFDGETQQRLFVKSSGNYV